MSTHFQFAKAATLTIILAASAPAYALQIIPTFDHTITNDPNSAAIESTINSAIADYQSALSTPITVSIDFKEMNTGLGMSSTSFFNIPYATFHNALSANAASPDDATALAHLPNASTNPVTGSANINVTTANIRALGITGFNHTGVDGTISLNTTITTPPGAPSSNNFSLRAVTEHEIDEVLGLGSSLPSPFANSPSPEDLFRYDSADNRSFTTAGDNAFFSLDGTTALVQFNQNPGGDFGDWHTSATPRIQDAFATPGATPTLGVELRALDVIGYTRAPEPGTLLTLAIFGAAALARRRTS